MTGPIDLITADVDENDPANIHTEIDLFLTELQTVIPQFNNAFASLGINDASDTSTSSNAIGTGSKTFTVTASKSFVKGMFLIIADSAAPSTNFMICQVTSYSSTTLIVSSLYAAGSGTKTSWTISLSPAHNQLTDQHEVIVSVANGRGSTNTAIPRFSVTFVEVGTDITYADSATLGASFTINNDGVYGMFYVHGSSVASDFGISLNSSELSTAIGSITSTDVVVMSDLNAVNKQVTVGAFRKLSSGDVIRPHENTTGTAMSTVRFSIIKLQSL